MDESTPPDRSSAEPTRAVGGSDGGSEESLEAERLGTQEAEAPTRTQVEPASGPTPTDGPDVTIDLPPVDPSILLGNRFQLIRPLDSGALGVVWVARDLELEREVAVKRITERNASDPASHERFLREADITCQLEHPGVVPVYGYGIDAKGQPWYAMRRVHGLNLRQSIARFERDHPPGRRDPAADLEFHGLLRRFLAVCGTIAYAHNRGVIHRDLKPGNIMIGDREGDTIVLDWGLGKPLGLPLDAEDDTETGTDSDHESGVKSPVLPRSGSDVTDPTRAGARVGTPRYMSPEQARGEPAAYASDVYGLGATLYHFLTGQAPFAEIHHLEVLEHVREGDFRRPRDVRSSIDPALEAICLKAMAHAPANRYATATALARDIERWLADEPVSVYRDRPATRLRRWARRRQALVASAAALGLALAAASVPLFFLYHRSATNEARAVASEQNTWAILEQVGYMLDRHLPRLARGEEVQRQLLLAGVDHYRRIARARPGDRAAAIETARTLGAAGELVARHESVALAGSPPASPLPMIDEAIDLVGPFAASDGVSAALAGRLVVRRAACVAATQPVEPALDEIDRALRRVDKLSESAPAGARSLLARSRGVALALQARLLELAGQAREATETANLALAAIEPGPLPSSPAPSNPDGSSPDTDRATYHETRMILARLQLEAGEPRAAWDALGKIIDDTGAWLAADTRNPVAQAAHAYARLESLRLLCDHPDIQPPARKGFPTRAEILVYDRWQVGSLIQPLRNEFRLTASYNRLMAEFLILNARHPEITKGGIGDLKKNLATTHQEAVRRLEGHLPNPEDFGLLARILDARQRVDLQLGDQASAGDLARQAATATESAREADPRRYRSLAEEVGDPGGDRP